VTVNVNATAASAPQRTSPRRRGGLDMRQRRRRAADRHQADARRTRAERYAEKKLAGWSYRKAYAAIGGNSEEGRATWRAAPGPETKQPARPTAASTGRRG